MPVRDDGPPAVLSMADSAGRVAEPVSVVALDLRAHGYVTEELFASGTATAYNGAGDLSADGRWSVRTGPTAPFRTRIVVRRPASPDRFNGTVLVEWFNVTSGMEACPDWTFLGPQIVADGYAYVGVSAQALGVAGGSARIGLPGIDAGRGLVASHPERYGTLTHPGDQFALDIFGQIGRALRGSGPPGALGPLRPDRMVAIGESQAAFFLTTYVNAIAPVLPAFDGFFIHSRGGSAASLGGIPIAIEDVPAGVRIRGDSAVPVFMFQTETDVGPMLDFSPARQPDSEQVCTWEVAGTAHGDAYMVGGFTDLLGCAMPVNDGPQHWVAHAALVALNRWVTAGVRPPAAPPLALASLSPVTIARDALGNALGGVRTPAVDVPVSALSGDAAPGASRICALFGTTVPFDQATLVGLYGDDAGYRAAFERSLDATIAAGFLLESDRHDLMDGARHVRVGAPAAAPS